MGPRLTILNGSACGVAFVKTPCADAMKRIFLFVATVCFAVVTFAQDSARFQIPATDEGLPGSGPIRRYDWFKKLWAEKRSGWAGRVQQDQKALVFLGDSITQGWGDNIGNSLPGVKVANRGIS